MEDSSCREQSDALIVSESESVNQSYDDNHTSLDDNQHLKPRGLERRLVRNSWILKEVVKQIKLAIPVSATLIFSQSVFFVSNIFVGHISDDPTNLDVAGLGFTYVNMIGVSVGIGLSTAADTLFSQTYGFKNYKRVGIVLQRAILILLLTAFPVIVLSLISEFLLLLMRQKACIVRLTADYVKILSIAIPIIYLLTLLQLYLQAQSIVLIFVVVGIIQNIVSALIHSLFLYVLDWGVLGAAAALVITHFLALIFLLLYIRVRGLHKKTWGGWSWSSLREWWPFLRLGLPGMLMVCLEWWAFEIGTMICGMLGPIELAINSVLFSTLAIVYMLGLGVSVAATVRVGNELGAGNPTQAKRAAYISLALGVVVSTLSGIFFIVFRYEIGKIFTSKPEVINGIAKVCYVAGPLTFFDLIMITASGILKGYGQQAVGAITNFVCFYIIGIPLAIYLALYRHLGVTGVWTGLAVADFIQMSVFIIVILCTNWKKQVKKAVTNAQDRKRVPSSIEGEQLLQHSNELQSLELKTNDELGNISEVQTTILDGVDQEESGLTSETTANSQCTERSDMNEDCEQLIDVTPEHLNIKNKLWLLVSKGCWFVLGSMMVVIAGVFSYFESDLLPDHNCTNITTGDYTF